MSDEIIWVNEGGFLDDAGNLITTTYVDLREEECRNSISALAKGCKREHALEDGNTILISKPARFRQYGEGLILDVQEGMAKEESVTKSKEEEAANATRQRAIAEKNEAHELLNSQMCPVYTETRSSQKTNSKSLGYGNEWWIFCTSIKPSDGEWDAWRGTLPAEYDHVSEIGQPAKFAQALARMVAEQLGAQGKDGWMQDTTPSAESARTKHRLQCVIHGPVVYTDRVYETLAQESEAKTRLAASIFTKGREYADQREYRFAIFNGGSNEETVSLEMSGMMRDALKRIEGGMVRVARAPDPDTDPDNSKGKPSGQMGATSEPVLKRTTVSERLTETQEVRSTVRTPDGNVESSDSERRERIREKTITQDYEPEEAKYATTRLTGRDGEELTGDTPTPELTQKSSGQDQEYREKEVVQELALEDREWNGGQDRTGDTVVAVHSGTGRAYKSFEDMLNDPAFPMSPAKTWQEAACSSEEIAKTYGAIENLAMKMAHIKVENRQDVASAGWYAMQCIRNIYARLGDIVESVWIERERFVVIRIKESERSNATGRIVIAPSGSYAYCLHLQNKESIGSGGVEWGTQFFPMGSEIENFETYGWPAKRRETKLVDDQQHEC